MADVRIPQPNKTYADCSSRIRDTLSLLNINDQLWWIKEVAVILTSTCFGNFQSRGGKVVPRKIFDFRLKLIKKSQLVQWKGMGK